MASENESHHKDSSKIQKIDLEDVLKKTSQVVDLYNSDELNKKNEHLSDLSLLKNHEIQLRWGACLSLAPKVFAKQKELRGWVALTWLHCLNKEKLKDAKKSSSVSRMEVAVNTIGSHSELFKYGPWASDLLQGWLTLKMQLIEDAIQAKDKKAEIEIDKLMSADFELNKDQKSQAFLWLGDLAGDREDLLAAKFFYQESIALKESKDANEKLEAVQKKLPSKLAKENKLAKGTLTVSEKAESVADVAVDEEKLEEKIRQSLSGNLTQEQSVAVIKDIVSLFNQFPAGRAARRLKDRPLELYNSISENALELKALHEMEAADPAKLLEWAQSLHKRQDYSGALVLAQKAYDKNPHSATVNSSLWISGRSSHFLGKYPEALATFAKLMAVAKGTDEAAEALFRTGLIQFRKKEFSKAVTSFERLLQQGKELGRDKYDLIAQYWLVRSLENTNKERAQKIAQALVARYPFTYYGLRLNSEAHAGKIIWPEPVAPKLTLSTKIYLVGSQKQTWSRFSALADAGWNSEAYKEYQEGPMIKDPTLKVSLAQMLASRHQYFMAIRILNDAMDAVPELRQVEYLKIGYPDAFESLFKKEAARYKLDVHLLRSLTRQESGFNMRAVSTSNALGLMQMIPPTAQEVSKKLNLKVELPEDMFRPEVNIPMGTSYIAQMIEQFHGNIPFALAAYNAGPHRLKLWLDGRSEVKSLIDKPSSAVEDEIWFDELPWTETSLYVKAIQRNMLIYKALER